MRRGQARMYQLLQGGWQYAASPQRVAGYTARVSASLENFLNASMQVTDDRGAVDHGFSFKRHNQAQHTMCAGVLGTHIEQHLLSLNLLCSLLNPRNCTFTLICNHGFPLFYLMKKIAHSVS